MDLNKLREDILSKTMDKKNYARRANYQIKKMTELLETEEAKLTDYTPVIGMGVPNEPIEVKETLVKNEEPVKPTTDSIKFPSKMNFEIAYDSTLIYSILFNNTWVQVSFEALTEGTLFRIQTPSANGVVIRKFYMDYKMLTPIQPLYVKSGVPVLRVSVIETTSKPG